MIKSVKLLVGKKEIELTLEEVTKLRDDLNDLLTKGPAVVWPTILKEIQYVPYQRPWTWYEGPWCGGVGVGTGAGYIGDPPGSCSALSSCYGTS